MRTLKTLSMVASCMIIATPVLAGTPTLAGAPAQMPAYKMEKGVKIYHTNATPRTTTEKGVKVHRLMPAPGYYFDHDGNQVRSAFDDQVKIHQKACKKARKKGI